MDIRFLIVLFFIIIAGQLQVQACLYCCQSGVNEENVPMPKKLKVQKTESTLTEGKLSGIRKKIVDLQEAQKIFFQEFINFCLLEKTLLTKEAEDYLRKKDLVFEDQKKNTVMADFIKHMIKVNDAEIVILTIDEMREQGLIVEVEPEN